VKPNPDAYGAQAYTCDVRHVLPQGAGAIWNMDAHPSAPVRLGVSVHIVNPCVDGYRLWHAALMRSVNYSGSVMAGSFSDP
jgi:hypothetical protein